MMRLFFTQPVLRSWSTWQPDLWQSRSGRISPSVVPETNVRCCQTTSIHCRLVSVKMWVDSNRLNQNKFLIFLVYLTKLYSSTDYAVECRTLGWLWMKEFKLCIFSPEDGGTILFETLVPSYKSTQLHNPKDHHRHLWLMFTYVSMARWITSILVPNGDKKFHWPLGNFCLTGLCWTLICDNSHRSLCIDSSLAVYWTCFYWTAISNNLHWPDLYYLFARV